MKYTLYNLQFIEYKNLMRQGKEAEYSHKMISIECKFKFICQNYEKVLKEMHNKNQMIEGLNSKIMDLQNQLQQSHYYTQDLELKIQKMQALQRSSSNKYIKSNMLVPGKMEYQNMDVKNMLQKQNIQGIDSNVSIKDQLHVAYNRFNHMSSSKSQPKSKEIIQQQKSRELLNEEEGFSKRLEQLKFRIGTQSQLLTKKHHSFKDITNSLQKSSKNLHIKAQAQNNGSLTLLKNKDILENEWIEGQQKSKTLHKIWQQRDSEIFRMDEIFESINDKLKQYEH